MFSLYWKVRDKAAVSNKPFIPDDRGHMSVREIQVQCWGITTETYLTVSVDKNTLQTTLDQLKFLRSAITKMKKK